MEVGLDIKFFQRERRKKEEGGVLIHQLYIVLHVTTARGERGKCEMAPLKYLEQEYPILDSNFQNFCATHGIFSEEDLLLHDLHVLVAFAEQQSTSERLKQGITQVLSIIDGQHQPWLNGMELLEDAQLNKHVLSTGCEGIDLLLQGGLRMGQLTELVGASSSGKTQLELNLRSQIQKGDCQVQLLIVDSMSSLVTPILGGGGSQGHALMTSAGFLLKKLAHEHNLVVLVTNHTVGGEGGISKPALGESWKSIPHVRLRLSHDQGSSIYNVSVFKHPSMASGKAARFTIYD
ncbi:DNA repair protein RAD51 homolog 4 isoform X4 [Juglans microcarpa x Juglans regia]|uniref:DNA repair protein RAD51 homolog 4 isoform X4 n=1 Tax=Juglans microcarpa x Juglans regia TaxID=2249226 RepID=UPI001B7E93DD|nr:DNA repair protein RAD51 homolog 4 isoform X4 [Juglans microcarpa x Juglans regia]